MTTSALFSGSTVLSLACLMSGASLACSVVEHDPTPRGTATAHAPALSTAPTRAFAAPRFLVGAGARVTLVDDDAGREVASVDLPPHDDPRPSSIVALAAAEDAFVALTATSDDEGGVLHRGVVHPAALTASPAGWTSGDGRLGAIGQELVLFERGEGARWRFVGGGPPRPSLACPVPRWLQTSASVDDVRVVGAAVPAGHDALQAFAVTLEDDQLVSCTLAPLAPFQAAHERDVVLHTFGDAPDARFGVAAHDGGLVLLADHVRVPIPGAFVGSAIVVDLAVPTGFLLVGDATAAGAATLVIATASGVAATIPLRGQITEAPSLDQLLALPRGVAVATSTGVTRIVVAPRGEITVSYRIDTAAPAHLAPAWAVAAESSHDR